ncbi:MAG: VRR-NUC domain-containing protein [Betaproteobacteria bacterium]
MSESNIQNLILLDVGKLTNVRLFRNNTGTGWQGKTLQHNGTRLVLESPRPINAGLCKGSSDLVGWTEQIVTPDMVGRKIAIFTAIECKTPTGRATAEQTNFIERVRNAGGYAGIARSPEDARKIIANP